MKVTKRWQYVIGTMISIGIIRFMPFRYSDELHGTVSLVRYYDYCGYWDDLLYLFKHMYVSVFFYIVFRNNFLKFLHFILWVLLCAYTEWILIEAAANGVGMLSVVIPLAYMFMWGWCLHAREINFKLILDSFKKIVGYIMRDDEENG